MMPPSVALIMEVETDNKARALQELHTFIKKHKGSPASTKFFFSRLGRVVFEKNGSVDIDDIMDDAIEAGAEDLETNNEDNIVVWTRASQTNQVAQTLGAKFTLEVLGADVIWSPNEDTRAKVSSDDELRKLTELLVALQDFADVQAVYSNVARGTVTQEAWDRLEEHLDV